MDQRRQVALNWVVLRVRLGLFVMAYNLGNFLRRLAVPEEMKHWSLTSLQTRMITPPCQKAVFQLAEVLVSMLGGDSRTNWFAYSWLLARQERRDTGSYRAKGLSSRGWSPHHRGSYIQESRLKRVNVCLWVPAFTGTNWTRLGW